ncbi:MAG: sensor histidine kinase [Candidatus Limnocylindrales bacterium]
MSDSSLPPDGGLGDPERPDRRPDRGHRNPSRSDYPGYRRRPWRHRPHDRPPWWPAGEPWPPQGEFPWRRVRRLFFIRFAIGVFLIFALVIVGPLIVIGLVLSAIGLPGPTTGFLAGAILLFIILAVAGAAGGARRLALPFGDLIEAAGRLEAGDYSARVTEYGRGPRELKSLVGAFNSMAARLEADERQRRSLLADVSHELRTPLAVLRGELEAMIDGVHPVDEAHVTAAVDQIGMLTQLVEDLRTLALAEAGTLALHKEPTDLAILANDAATSFEGLAASAGVRLEVEMPGEMPLIDLDPLRIQQVIGNLAANALRYAPPGTAVTISGRIRPLVVEVSVVDHGPGIAPEVLPNLFERFAKTDDSRGSGLGLAIARRLVEAHGGTIRAESRDGGGTNITFELPSGLET